MKKVLVLLAIIINGITFGQSKEYRGTVKLKNDKYPLPGVNIVVEGTRVGTQTDFDGNFSITVPDTLRVLVFSYLGVKTLNYKLDEVLDLKIELKEDCTICYLYGKHIGISYFVNTKSRERGGLLDLFFPYAFGVDAALQLKYGYLNNKGQNGRHYLEFGLTELVKDCDYIGSFRFIHNNIKMDKNNFSYKDYRIEGEHEFSLGLNRSTSIYTGIGLADYKKAGNVKTERGYEIGLKQELPFRYVRVSVYVKTTYWSSFWQFQSGVYIGFQGVNLSYNYNVIGAYVESNIGLGYSFNL